MKVPKVEGDAWTRCGEQPQAQSCGGRHGKRAILNHSG
jgi:hypothetical protein